MSVRKQYRKRPELPVIAVALDIDIEEMHYRKWGHQQTAKRGDWLVDNDGDIYTVENQYFQDHYRKIKPGQYEKVGEIWAVEAEEPGSIPTKEGSTDYNAGDYLVYDSAEGGNGYAVGRARFKRMYEPLLSDEELTEKQQQYLQRIAERIEWFDAKATRNSRWHFTSQTLVGIFAAAVPVVAVYGETNDISTSVAMALLGGFSAAIAAIAALFGWQANWVRYRNGAEELASHKAQLNANVGPYRDRNNAFVRFAETCESIIAAERGQWAERFQDLPPERNKEN